MRLTREDEGSLQLLYVFENFKIAATLPQIS